jgi:hypothetical protein
VITATGYNNPKRLQGINQLSDKSYCAIQGWMMICGEHRSESRTPQKLQKHAYVLQQLYILQQHSRKDKGSNRESVSRMPEKHALVLPKA